MKLRFCLLLGFILLTGLILVSCGPVWDGGAPYNIAIPDGTYVVGTTPTGETIPARTVCASDNSRPAITDLNQLSRFGDITSNSLIVTVAGTNITKVWTRDASLTSVFPDANTAYSNATCTATWTGTIAVNMGTTFQETGDYTITWSPANCQMEIHDYGTPSIGGAWIPLWVSSTFKTTSSTTDQKEWEVSRDADIFTLKMPDSVASEQTKYSCADGTKVVKMIWTKQ
jgi:hypothetical protein